MDIFHLEKNYLWEEGVLVCRDRGAAETNLFIIKILFPDVSEAA